MYINHQDVAKPLILPEWLHAYSSATPNLGLVFANDVGHPLHQRALRRYDTAAALAAQNLRSYGVAAVAQALGVYGLYAQMRDRTADGPHSHVPPPFWRSITQTTLNPSSWAFDRLSRPPHSGVVSAALNLGDMDGTLTRQGLVASADAAEPIEEGAIGAASGIIDKRLYDAAGGPLRNRKTPAPDRAIAHATNLRILEKDGVAVSEASRPIRRLLTAAAVDTISVGAAHRLVYGLTVVGMNMLFCSPESQQAALHRILTAVEPPNEVDTEFISSLWRSATVDAFPQLTHDGLNSPRSLPWSAVSSRGIGLPWYALHFRLKKDGRHYAVVGALSNALSAFRAATMTADSVAWIAVGNIGGVTRTAVARKWLPVAEDSSFIIPLKWVPPLRQHFNKDRTTDPSAVGKNRLWYDAVAVGGIAHYTLLARPID